jgi:hypothetical protein
MLLQSFAGLQAWRKPSDLLVFAPGVDYGSGSFEIGASNSTRFPPLAG